MPAAELFAGHDGRDLPQGELQTLDWLKQALKTEAQCQDVKAVGRGRSGRDRRFRAAQVVESTSLVVFAPCYRTACETAVDSKRTRR